MTDCLFCKIIQGEINTEFVYEDEDIVVFNDIRPKASVHLLVVPRAHVVSLAEIEKEHEQLMGRVMLRLKDIADAHGLINGFRTIINTGRGGGQEIDHIHLHILGGGGLPGF